jgi:hypothetical protein
MRQGAGVEVADGVSLIIRKVNRTASDSQETK